MYRTDKQFMTNPATAGSRIYIGGLPKTIVAQDLEDKFSAHGKILGLVLQMGFAFIQYENEGQAHAAIQNEANTMLHGRKINVKQALDKSQKAGNNHNNQNQNRRQGGPMGPGPGGPPPLMQQPQHHLQQFQQQQQQHAPPQMQHGPPQMQHHAPPQQQHHQQQQQKPPMRMNNDAHPAPLMKPPGQEHVPPPLAEIENEMPETPGPPLNNQGMNAPPMAPKNVPLGGPGNKNMSPMASKNAPPPINPMMDEQMDGPPLQGHGKRGRKRRARSRDRFPQQPPPDMYRDEPQFYGRDDYNAPPQYNHPVAGPPVPPGPPGLDQPDRNDCEIIVVSKPLTKYAEYIEQRLKALGLIVDLLFPNEDVPIGRVLANISSRGCLYAILVMPQNEEHRSLTLNVLHGIPQEHRNMPIEDALVLITRNFDAYMRGDKTSTESTGGTMGISDRHPTTMQLLLNLLAENRQITSTQYDRLLKYLQERREVQNQHEIDEGVDQDSQESNSKQAELQSRIMNILNKSATENAPPPPEVSQSSSDVAPPLLKDPSVQKALDSLLGGEMFKNISVAL